MQDGIEEPACGQIGMLAGYRTTKCRLEQAQDGGAFEACGQLEGQKRLAGLDKGGEIGVWDDLMAKVENRLVYAEGKEDDDDKGAEVLLFYAVGWN